MTSAKYEELTQKLKRVLPINACPIRELLPLFKNNENPVKLNTLLKITNVYNTGDISGIKCIVDVADQNPIACALTHLIISEEEPLYKDIVDYQKKRTKRIKQLNRR